MKKFISIFNISIIENTLEFELSTLDKWYAINRKRNITKRRNSIAVQPKINCQILYR